MPTIFSTQNHHYAITKPLLVVCGCTGTGKSDLGLAIAKKFNGEVINADSMQIYRGLDITTNKMTSAEMDGVPHHLIGFLEPSQSNYNVHDFKNSALALIEKLWDNDRLPILVGGTGYYIESVIFDNNLVEHDRKNTEKIRQKLLHDFPTPDMIYQELQRVDPATASQLHRRNKSRVLRALEIFHSTGKMRSEHQRMQRLKAGANSHHFSARLRYQNTFLINLDAPKEVLIERLYKRVDKMMERGLLDELVEFHKEYKGRLDEQFGIMQSIGFKEFLPYLKLDESERDSKKGHRMLRRCMEMLKIQNRQYAQRQRQWFYKRILVRGDHREIPESIALDSISNDFYSQIVPFTIKLVEKFLADGNIDGMIDSTTSPLLMELPPLNDRLSRPNYPEESKKIAYCDVCELEIEGLQQWEMHLAGKKHRNNLCSKTRKCAQE